MAFETKSSGSQDKFETGAVRDVSTGKPRFDLVPTMPLRRLAELYARGASHYGESNWMKGIPLRRLMESAERHLQQIKAGDTSEDHCAAVLWNIMAYMWTLNEIEYGRLPKSLDNRLPPEPQYDESLKKAEAPKPIDKLSNLIYDYLDAQSAQRNSPVLKIIDITPDTMCRGCGCRRGDHAAEGHCLRSSEDNRWSCSCRQFVAKL